MTKRLGLSAMPRSTQAAPLAALGAFLQQRAFFAPLWEHVQLGGKTISHEPHQKRRDVVVRMLADGSSLKQLKTRLRPETTRAAAWGRDVFADQATISRTLDAFPPATVAQWRTAVERLYVREGRARPQPLDQAWLFWAIDLTGGPAGRHAEASTQGSCSGHNTVAGGSSPGCVPRRTRSTWCPWSIPATRPARPVGTPRSQRWSGCWV